MTINVAVTTSEAIVFGCDSIASASGWFLDPFSYVERDGEGNLATDDEGRFIARFPAGALTSVVTDAWGGATKMFALCGGNNPVAAVTAGTAALNGHNIHAIGRRFCEATTGRDFQTVRDVALAFCDFVALEYDTHFAATDAQFRGDLEFLIGGYGARDTVPSLFRLKMRLPAADRIEAIHGLGDGFTARTGIAWAGQSDGVERLIFGYDGPLKALVERVLSEYAESVNRAISQAVVRVVTELLQKLEAVLPEDLNMETATPESPKIRWDSFQLPIAVANLPLQDAVELASYLVSVQSGRSKYTTGVPTVGGRTHIGVIRRGSFEMLDEPKLVHRNQGYGREI